MPLEKQVTVVYAVNNGYLDNIDVFSVMDSASVSGSCSPKYPVFLPVMLKKK